MICFGVGNLRKRLRGRPRLRWEDYNEMDLENIFSSELDLIGAGYLTVSNVQWKVFYYHCDERLDSDTVLVSC
jgi:hypothetical protein